MRILLVDDTPELREMLPLVMSKDIPDVSFVTAENGAEALILLQTVQFDVVVTDCQMPVMTGIEFVAKARELGMTVPIFMWSGEVAPKVTGINGFFSKADTKGLIEAVRRAA